MKHPHSHIVMLSEAKHPYCGFLTAFGMTQKKCPERHNARHDKSAWHNIACHAERSASAVKHPHSHIVMLSEAKHPYCGFLTAFGMTQKKCSERQKTLEIALQKSSEWKQMLQSKPVCSYFVSITQAKNFSTFLNKQCYGFASG